MRGREVYCLASQTARRLYKQASVNEGDYVVKHMKFAEVTSLLTRIIRILIKGTTGNFAGDSNYRTVIAANSRNYDLYIG